MKYHCPVLVDCQQFTMFGPGALLTLIALIFTCAEWFENQVIASIKLTSENQKKELPSYRVAEFVKRTTYADIPAAVRKKIRLHILDALGLGLASLAYPYAQAAVAGAASLGNGDCSVIGSKQRFDARDAAFANGVLIHGLDFDDTHPASIIHPTCTSLPCALALAEFTNASGADLIAAFLVGAELAIRFGLVVDGGFHHVGYHATGVASHYASAASAAKLLGLNLEQTVSALGITGSTASGIQVFLEEGAWTKRMHPGWGAVAGITAARLAQNGFKGPLRPLEGKFGLLETHLQGHADKANMNALVLDLGESWHFGDTALKPYPVCHFIHGCADAAIELHREIGDTNIESVAAYLAEPTLHIIAEPAESKQEPGNDYEAKFSAQFVVAYCLLHGHFGLPDLEDAALADPSVRALARRVTCHKDTETRFPEYFSGGVEVTLGDGRKLRKHIAINSGAGARALPMQAVIDKFMASASLSVDHQQAERICNAVLELEKVSVSKLMALLRGE